MHKNPANFAPLKSDGIQERGWWRKFSHRRFTGFGGGGCLEKGRRRLMSVLPPRTVKLSGFEHRRHRKSSITFRNNSGLAVTSFSF